MDKVKKKTNKSNDKIRTMAIYWTAGKYLVSPQYVYGLLNGNNRAYGRADEIIDAYRKKYAELQEVLS